MANLLELALVLKSLNYRDMARFANHLERRPYFTGMAECLLSFADDVEEQELEIAQNISGPDELWSEIAP